MEVIVEVSEIFRNEGELMGVIFFQGCFQGSPVGEPNKAISVPITVQI